MSEGRALLDAAMTERRTVTVRLPMPDARLGPNRSKGLHWAQRMRLVAAHREWAGAAAVAAKPASGTWHGTTVLDPTAPIVVTATVRLAKGGKHWDDDNFKAACKAYLDGFTDAQLWGDDRQARWGAVTWERDPSGRGEVLLTLTEED